MRPHIIICPTFSAGERRDKRASTRSAGAAEGGVRAAPSRQPVRSKSAVKVRRSG